MISSPYKCPVHLVWLVRRVWPEVKLMSVVRNKRNPDAVSYFACPVAGCDFKKPNKWQKRRI